MDADQVLKNAAHNGVALTVPPDRDKIVATPRDRVTEELAQGIRSNKDRLMRDLLMRQALAYLNARWVKGASTEALADAGDYLNRCYGLDFGQYRAAIRTYVEQGLAEIRRARSQQGRGAA